MADIDLLGNPFVQQQMVWTSITLLALGICAGIIGGVALPHEQIGPLWFVILVVVSLVALPLHELVHAAAFLLLSGFSAHIRFGFTGGMLYTSAVGTILPRRRFCIVLLAPAVIVTTVLVLAAFTAGYPLMGWFLAAIHLAGCTGDFALARAIFHEPLATYVQDTERGVAFFYDE